MFVMTESPPTGAVAFAAARDVSGMSSKRKIPERQNATTDTMIANRSVDSAGALAGADANGNRVKPSIAV